MEKKYNFSRRNEQAKPRGSETKLRSEPIEVGFENIARCESIVWESEQVVHQGSWYSKDKSLLGC